MRPTTPPTVTVTTTTITLPPRQFTTGPRGEISVGEDRVECGPCDPGTEPAADGALCTACDPGSFSEAGEPCLECVAGRFAAHNGSSACERCVSPRTTLDMGSTSWCVSSKEEGAAAAAVGPLCPGTRLSRALSHLAYPARLHTYTVTRAGNRTTWRARWKARSTQSTWTRVRLTSTDMSPPAALALPSPRARRAPRSRPSS